MLVHSSVKYSSRFLGGIVLNCRIAFNITKKFVPCFLLCRIPMIKS